MKDELSICKIINFIIIIYKGRIITLFMTICFHLNIKRIITLIILDIILKQLIILCINILFIIHEHFI